MSDAEALQPLPPGGRRNLIVLTTLIVSVMASIDATIVTVALPYMQGSLDATPVSITWVVTMFAIGLAIGTAITGRLADMLGRKRVMIISVIGFVVMSVLCGLSGSLNEMVLFRFLQGLFAASLIPLALAVLVDVYPPQERTKGLSIWSMGVMAGPAMGPALGGVLTQAFDWQPVFYVNVPVGAVALLLCMVALRPTPRRRVRIGWISFVLVSVFVICFQVFADKGNNLDWFAGRPMQVLFGVSILSGLLFFYYGLTDPDSVLDLKLLGDRNFLIGTSLVTVVGMIFFGVLVVMPEYLEDELGWQVNTSGLVIGVFGVGGFISSYLAGRIEKHTGPRPLIALGALMLGVGALMGSTLNMDVGPAQLALVGMTMGMGLMFAFVPLSSLAFASLQPAHRNQGSAVFNFLKAIGFSAGVGFVSTLMYRGQQANWNHIGGHITPWNPGLEPYVDLFGDGGWNAQTATQLSLILDKQSAMVTILHVFEWMALLSFLMLPLVLFARSGRAKQSPASESAA